MMLLSLLNKKSYLSTHLTLAISNKLKIVRLFTIVSNATLICHNAKEKEIPILHSQLLCKKWTWSELCPTHGLGHRTILDDDDIAKGVLRFIQAS